MKNSMFKKYIPLTTLAKCCMVLCSVSYAQWAFALGIVKTEIKEFADRSELRIEFTEPLNGRIGLFRIANPDRQVIDLPVVISTKDLPVTLDKDSRIKKAEVVAVQDRSRLVFELANQYEVKKTEVGELLVLTFSGPRPFVPGSEQGANLSTEAQLRTEVAKALAKPSALESNPELLDWSLETTDDEEIVRLKFNQKEVRLDAFMREQELRIRVSQGKIGKGVALRQPNPKSGLFRDARLESGTQALTLRLALNNAVHSIRQADNTVELVLKRAPAASGGLASAPAAVGSSSGVLRMDGVMSSKAVTKPSQEVGALTAKYGGRPISLDFKDADIRTVMQVFADFSKMNLVLSDQVQGKITVYLKDVPWDQALDIVMRTKGLVARHSGNVLLVSTPAEVTGSQLEAATRTAQDDLEPLVAQTFTVSYQKTGDVTALLGAKDSKLLSSRGAMLADERTGQIFVQDTPSRLERIGAIIRSIDRPVRQVMIEAKIILADLSVSKQLGVTLQGASLPADAVDSVSTALGRKGFINTSPTSATNFAYTKFNRDATRLINVQLQALETDNRIRTVSNPRVITSNKQAAIIEQGSEIPYQVATSSGATSTEFKKATMSLKVTPQIAPDGTILLEVEVTKDSIGVATPNGPAIDTRRVQTRVLINDGGTVVLGGIFEEDDNRTIDKIPGLGDMPFIGNLFRALDDRKRRAELLVFLTPVVLQDS